MKVLFEEHQYNTEDVKNILGSLVLSGLDLNNKVQQLRYVGYFYNADIENKDGTKGDLVFILPKVLLDKDNKAFGLDPEKLINFNWKDWKKDEFIVDEGGLTKRNVYDFLYGFSTWIYRAIDIYRKNQKRKPIDEQDSNAAKVLTSVQIDKSGSKKESTLMDVLLSLLEFQTTHKNFITFVMKMAHSGFNKISWQRTIAKTRAIVQDDCPIYVNPVNKKRVVNFDEELLIIYFSILNYMHEEYGFPIPNQPGYKLIKGAMFKSYIKSQGKTRLHKIRYKYFSDSAILLWNLCYAFFDKVDYSKAQANRKDYLLVNSFHYVFEAMIDELVGDKNLPHSLKNHKDDKRIDHLYSYKYLLENMNDRIDEGKERDMYNIADSKYYKRSETTKRHDVPKQFTYARNVIQWHMDLIHHLLKEDDKNAAEYRKIPLFDEISEGYNIIPNFFISALVNEKLDYDKSNLAKSTLGDGKNVHESFHFWERLFDRSTMFTLHYDVNFLYVLKMYAQNRSYDKAKWKREVHEMFRNSILEYLKEEYKFYQVLIHSDEVENFVDRYFRRLTGKIFTFTLKDKSRVLLYAERKSQRDGKAYNYEFCKERDIYVEDDSILHIPNGESVNVKNIALGFDGYDKVEKEEKKVVEIGGGYLSTAEEDIYTSRAAESYYENLDDVPDEKKEDVLPLYMVDAYCGAFETNDEPVQEGWVVVPDGIGLNKNKDTHFIVYAVGRSMEPKIHDGDLCVFEKNNVPSNDDIVLSESTECGEYGCAYVIKKFIRVQDENDLFSSKIILKSLNSEFDDIELVNDGSVNYRIVGIYKGIIPDLKKEMIERIKEQ